LAVVFKASVLNQRLHLLAFFLAFTLALLFFFAGDFRLAAARGFVLALGFGFGFGFALALGLGGGLIGGLGAMTGSSGAGTGETGAGRGLIGASHGGVWGGRPRSGWENP
jgi:hypothetical protein